MINTKNYKFKQKQPISIAAPYPWYVHNVFDYLSSTPHYIIVLYRTYNGKIFKGSYCPEITSFNEFCDDIKRRMNFTSVIEICHYNLLMYYLNKTDLGNIPKIKYNDWITFRDS